MNKQYKLLTCTINGKKVEKMIDVRASLTGVEAFPINDYIACSTFSDFTAFLYAGQTEVIS